MADAAPPSEQPVFSTRSFAALERVAVASASNQLATLERRGQIARLTRGLWVRPHHPHFTVYGCVPHILGRELGYVSFLTALHLHGMLSQIPKAVQIATTGPPRTLATRFARFELFRLHPRMLGEGVSWHDAPLPFRLASPEKALLDTFYLATRRGRRFARLPELELPRGFRKSELLRLAREQVPHLPIRQAIVRRIEEELGTARGAVRR